MATKTSPSRRPPSRASTRGADVREPAPQGRLPSEAAAQEEAPRAHPPDPLAARARRAGHRPGRPRAARGPRRVVRRPARSGERAHVAPARRRSASRRFAFPVVGVYWGVVLLRDIAREERVRMFIGFIGAGVGVLGIVSLLGGTRARSRLRRRRASTGSPTPVGSSARSSRGRCRACSPRSGRRRLRRARGARRSWSSPGRPSPVADVRDFFTAAVPEEREAEARGIQRERRTVASEPRSRSASGSSGCREVLGLARSPSPDDESVIVPEAERDRAGSTTTRADAEPATRAASDAAGRKVETDDGPLPAAAARPASRRRRRPPRDGRRRGRDHGGPRAHARHLRRRRAGDGRAPRAHGHDVRGGGRAPARR